MGADTLELIPDAIRIFVDDTSAAQTFYRETLRLPLRSGSPEQGYLVFGIGGMTLVVEAADPDDKTARLAESRAIQHRSPTPDRVRRCACERSAHHGPEG